MTTLDDMAAKMWMAEVLSSTDPTSTLRIRHREAFDEQHDDVKNRCRKYATVALDHAEQVTGLLRIALMRLEQADQFIAANRGGNGLRNPARTDAIHIVREFLK